MEIKTFKRTVSSVDKDGVKFSRTFHTEKAIFTKSEAAENMQEMYEMIYDFTEGGIENKIFPEDKKEKIKKLRNRIGYLKNLKIIIK